jgi:uncharacterized SAM-binding protein YcdF (DUF218 family)
VIISRTGQVFDESSTKSMSRRRIWIGAVLIVAGVIVAGLAIFAKFAGRLLVVNAPESSDVILVLAGETDLRPTRAIELMDQGYGHRVLINVPAATRIYGFSQVELAEKYVQGFPRAGEFRICPIEGLSTKEEALDAEKCLANEGGTRVLIVTSEFHTRRALSVFRHEVHGKHFSVAAARDERQFGTRWWSHRQWAKTCFDEWMRLLWWSAVERWR